MILITGASGKTGRSLAALLDQRGIAYRAGSRPVLDWTQVATWDAALDGVTSVYLVAPGTVGDVYALVQDFMVAATRKGVRRLVFLGMSGLPAGGPAHGQVHQWLRDNSDDWSVLAPSAFMQNFTVGPSLATIREEDQIYSNTGTGRVPFIDAEDIAACAFAALTSPSPLNTEFVLTGDESLSYDRVAELISKACGRHIAHTQVSTEDMAQRLIKRGIAEATATFLAFGYQTIAAGMQDRTTDVVRTLTGRAPTSFETFAKANADVWARLGKAP